jgi:hypothetical protein
MKNLILLGATLAIGAIAFTLNASSNKSTSDEAAFTAHPVEDPAFVESLTRAPVELLYAAPFELLESATHFWRADQPTYQSGLVLVVEVDPNLAQQRQTLEPVLYVGGQTAERVNNGYPSGRLVLIVPNLDLDGLASAPMFYGAPALPEQLTAEAIATELAIAVDRGNGAPTTERITAATRDAIGAVDLGGLYFELSHVIEEYSPEETDLIRGFRVPR